MVKILLIFILSVIVWETQAQVIDEIRLAYDESKILAKQIDISPSPDGRYFGISYNSNLINIFDTYSQKFISSLSIKIDNDFSEIKMLSGDRIIIIQKDEIKIFNWRKKEELRTFKLLNTAVVTAFNPSTKYLAVGQKKGLISLFDTETLRETKIQGDTKTSPRSIAIDPSGQFIAVTYVNNIITLGTILNENPIFIYEVRTGKEVKHFDDAILLAFDEDGNLLSSTLTSNGGTLNPKMKIYNSTSFNLKKSFSYQLGKATYHQAIMVNNRIVLSSWDHSFDVFENGKMTYTSLWDKSVASLLFKKVSKPIMAKLNGSKYLFASQNSNVSRIYDADKNKVVGYFYTNGGNEFCFVSKDGKVDGDINAINSVYWTSRKSDKKTSLERTLDKSFTPRLITQVINEKNFETKDFDIDNVINKLPSIELKTVNNELLDNKSQIATTLKLSSVEIGITENLNEVTEVKLYQNSKLIKIQQNTGSSKYKFDVSLTNSFGEENYFYAVASSNSGVDSEKLKFTIKYKNGSKESKAKLYIVTIGINQYRNPKYNLNYAQADADGVETAIKQLSTSLFQEIIPYNIRNDNAIKENIISALEDIKNKSNEQDVLIWYFAGHGVVAEVGSGGTEFYIVPHDVTQLYGRSDVLLEKAISAMEIKDLALKINAQKQVFILDACQSAAALESIVKRGAEEEKAIAQLARSTGTFWITSTGSDQFATEFEKLGHGVFTYSLLEGIKGDGDSNKDKKLTIRELTLYIENKVPDLSEQLKGKPQFPSAYSFGNDFPIVLYK